MIEMIRNISRLLYSSSSSIVVIFLFNLECCILIETKIDVHSLSKKTKKMELVKTACQIRCSLVDEELL